MKYLYLVPIAILLLAFAVQEAPMREEIEPEPGKILPEPEPVKITPISKAVRITPIREIIPVIKPVRGIAPIRKIRDPPIIPRPPPDNSPM